MIAVLLRLRSIKMPLARPFCGLRAKHGNGILHFDKEQDLETLLPAMDG